MNISIQPKVAIILVNYNSWQDTIECINSIYSSIDHDDFFICLVDNSTSAESRLKITEFVDSINFDIDGSNIYLQDNSFFRAENIKRRGLYLFSMENRGFAAANNLVLVELLKKDFKGYVWILNNDTVIAKDSLSELIKSIEASSTVGISGSCLLYYNRPSIIQGIGGKYNKFFATSVHLGEGLDISFINKLNSSIDYPIGASMLVRSEFISQVGLMNESFFLYFEELDWVLRGRKFGFQHNVSMNSFVYHKEGSSIGTKNGSNKSLLSDYWSLKNRIVFTRVHFPQYLVIVYLSFSFVIFNRLRRLQFAKMIQVFRILCEA